MKIERIVPNLTVTDLSAAVREHTEILGLEEWGVTRFFCRDSAGNVINVGKHTS